jgi:hypothetical protein
MQAADQALSRKLRVVSRKGNVASAIAQLQRAYVTL